MCVKLIYKDAVWELGGSAETCIYSHDATAQDGLKHHRMCGCVCVWVCVMNYTFAVPDQSRGAVLSMCFAGN